MSHISIFMESLHMTIDTSYGRISRAKIPRHRAAKELLSGCIAYSSTLPPDISWLVFLFLLETGLTSGRAFP